ncbi:MAG: GAF domain-containing protein [Bacteroidota bacterium]|nr:GAF domain-containing protein [Bacteroidota bacterium]
MVAEEIHININDAPTAILAIDGEEEIFFFNNAAEKIFGKISGGMKFSALRHSNDIPEILKNSTAVKLTLDEGATLQLLKSSTGKPVYTSVYFAPGKDGFTSVFIRDISSQIKYIAQVKQQLEVESDLQKSSHIGSGNLEDALNEIAVVASETIEVTRMNIWKFDEGFTSLRSLVNYDKNDGGFTENITLYHHQFPNYFKLMLTEEMIVTVDAMNSPRTVEIRESYIVPFGILSMLDIPIRIEGKMVGVACFEDTKQLRQWNVSEQNFAVSVAQIIAQTLETHHRQQVQQDLEQALSEKKLLLAEINHRVKNNFSLISDLIRFQEAKTKDEFHQKLFAEIRGRLLSMTMIHRQLYLTDNFGAVNFRDFLLDLAAHFRTTFANEGVAISTLLDNCRLPIGKAVLCGLVINELLTHACRKAFEKHGGKLVTLRMNAINDTISISVSDNGGGVKDPHDSSTHELIKELVGQLKGSIELSTPLVATTTLSFSIS